MSSIPPLLPDDDQYNAEIRDVFVVKNGVPFIDPSFYTQLILDAMEASAGPAQFAVRMVGLMVSVRGMAVRAVELDERDSVISTLESMLAAVPDDPQSEKLF